MDRIRRIGLGLSVAFLTTLAQPGGAQATADNGVIAGVTQKGVTGAIFTVNPDGTSYRVRTLGSAPAWSPDGSRLAFIDPSERISVITGSGVVRTGVQADGSDIFSAARVDWSPDGTKIVYARNTQIWVMNANPPYDPVRLTNGGCGDYEPTWSPDGTRIAFSEGCTGAITIMNADGTGQTPVPNPLGLSGEERPDWSPDGTQLVFLAGLSGHSGVWLMDVDGSDQRFLAETVDFCCGSPEWSPDGTKILFVASTNHIDMIDPDGTNRSEIPTPHVAYEPRWGTMAPGA
jgi:Tol biopolymer transport system component